MLRYGDRPRYTSHNFRQGTTVLVRSMPSLSISDTSSQLCILAFLHELRISFAQLVTIYSPLAVVAVLVGGREPAHTVSITLQFLEIQGDTDVGAKVLFSLNLAP